MDNKTKKPILLILIHGIRTDASWQEKVKHEFEEHSNIQVIPIKYGYLDVFRFWFPFGTRKKSVATVSRRVQNAINQYPDHEVVIIAHSFGTYAITLAIADTPLLKIHRLILCGAIVPRFFKWDIARKQLGTDNAKPLRNDVVNECGSLDIWPILAESTTFGFGSSGTFGFGTSEVTDRYHKFYHGDYFDEVFVRNYWVPFVMDGEIRGSEWDRTRPATPLRYQILRLPFNYIWALVLLVFITLMLLHGWRYLFEYENRLSSFSECFSHIVYPTQLFDIVQSDRSKDQKMLIHKDGLAKVYLNSRILNKGESIAEIADQEANNIIMDYESDGYDWSVVSGFYTPDDSDIEYENYVRFRTSHKGKYVHRYEMIHPRPERTNHRYWNINESLAGSLRSDGGISEQKIKDCWKD